MPQYQLGFFADTSALGTMRHPPNGMGDMVSTPPAIIQSAMPALIFAVANAMVSRPEEQYLFTVTPGTLSVFKPIKDTILPMFKPCSASGVAFPTITSSILLTSNSGSVLTKCFTVAAAKSSGRVNRKIPRGAFPTAVLNPFTIYAFILTVLIS